ncbi:MAG: heparinase II/III family protein [Deltaproteobacteria bacterium]|nr:heparinase II/III family protein [Deltaproteobacteria bacterium]
MRALGIAAWTCMLFALACGDAATGPDAGADAGCDGSADADAGGDAGADAGGDAVADAGGDAGADAGGDAGGDAGADAGGDGSADAGGDAGADAGGDAGGDAGADAGGDAGADAGGDTGGDPAWDPFVDDCPVPDVQLACRSSRPRIEGLALETDGFTIRWRAGPDEVTTGFQVEWALPGLDFEPLGALQPSSATQARIRTALVPGQAYLLRVVPASAGPLPGTASPIAELGVPAGDPGRPHLIALTPETFPEPYGPGLHLTFDPPAGGQTDIEIQFGTDGETWPIEAHTDPSLYTFRNLHGPLGEPGSDCLGIYFRCLPDGQRSFARARWDASSPWSNIVTGVVTRYRHPRTFLSPEDLEAMRLRYRGAADLVAYRVWAAGQVAPWLGEAVSLPAPYADESAHLEWGQKAYLLALHGLLADEPACIDQAAEILRAYAVLLDGFAPSQTFNWGIVVANQLREAVWVEQLALAYDFVMAAGALAEADAAAFREHVLRKAISQFDFRELSNHQIWHLAARAAAACALGERPLLEDAIDGSGAENDCGWTCQISEAFHDDGLHWERSPGYDMYSLRPMLHIAQLARTWKLDIEARPAPDGTGYDGDSGPRDLFDCLDGTWRQLLPGDFYPAWGDSHFDFGPANTSSRQVYRLAYSLYGDAAFAMLGLGSRCTARDGSLQAAPPWKQWTASGYETDLRVTLRGCDPGIDGPVLRLQPEDPAYATRGCVHQTFEIEPGPAACVFSGRVRGRGVGAGGFRLRLKCEPDCGDNYVLEQGADEPWAPFEASWTPPAAAQRLKVEYFLWNAAGILDLCELSARCDGVDVLLNPRLATQSVLETGGQLLIDYRDPLPDPGDLQLGFCSASFAATGQDSAASSLAPSSGRVMLRTGHGRDAAAATLFYGPYGTGHGHPDMLSIMYTAGGARALWEHGTTTYETDPHRYWINSAISHNAVVPDRRNQRPQDLSPHGYWTSWPDRWARAEHGSLVEYTAVGELARARASDLLIPDASRAYPGFVMDRTAVLHRGVLADRLVIEPQDGQLHEYQMIQHVLGSLSTASQLGLPWTVGPHPLGRDDGDAEWDLDEIGYRYLEGVQARWLELGASEQVELLFDLDDGPVFHLWIEGPGTLYLARPPGMPSAAELDMVVLLREQVGPATFWHLGWVEGATSTVASPVPVWSGSSLIAIDASLDGVAERIPFEP